MLEENILEGIKVNIIVLNIADTALKFNIENLFLYPQTRQLILQI